MDLELLRLRRPHKVSLFPCKTLCKTPHRHSTSNLCRLMFAFPRRCTLLSSSASVLRRQRSFSRLTQWSPHCSIRSSHCATIVCCPGALTVRVNVLSVHLKSDLYLDGICVVCVASPSVRSRRLETRTCSSCSIGHSTCIYTLQVSLRDSVAPPSASKRPSLEESFIMHSRLGLITRFVLNAPMALHGRNTMSCPTHFLLHVIRYGTRSL